MQCIVREDAPSASASLARPHPLRPATRTSKGERARRHCFMHADDEWTRSWRRKVARLSRSKLKLWIKRFKNSLLKIVFFTTVRNLARVNYCSTLRYNAPVCRRSTVPRTFRLRHVASLLWICWRHTIFAALYDFPTEKQLSSSPVALEMLQSLDLLMQGPPGKSLNLHSGLNIGHACSLL